MNLLDIPKNINSVNLLDIPKAIDTAYKSLIKNAFRDYDKKHDAHNSGGHHKNGAHHGKPQIKKVPIQHKINVDKHLDKSKQPLTREYLEKILNTKMPRALRRAVRDTTFIITDRHASGNTIGITMTNIRIQTSKSKTIRSVESETTFYACRRSDYPGVIYHECAHVLDAKMGKGFNDFSNEARWQEAVKKDHYHYISDYAKTNSKEDFAESVEKYIVDNKRFEKECPNRYKLIKSFLHK